MANSVKLNIVYSIGYNLINVLAPFIILPYVARILKIENLGLYSYYNTIAYYFVLFTTMGLANYGSRSIAEVRENKELLSKTFSDIYYMQVFMSIILVIIYLLWSICFCDYSVLSLLLSFYVLSAGIDISWLYSGLEEFNILLVRNFVIKVFNLIFVFLFVHTIDDLFIYVAIMSVGILIGNGTMWFRLNKRLHFCKFNLKRTISHVKPNLILFIPVIAISIYNAMSTIMLGYLTSMKEVGLFDNAIKVITIPQVIIAAIGSVMLPKASNLLAKGQEENALNYFKSTIIIMACISAIITYVLITIAPEFIEIYFGNDFSKCVLLLNVLMPCMIFKAYGNVIRTQYIIPKKADRVYVVSVCGGAIINFIINLILIPKLQSIGACIGTITAEILVCVYQMVYVLKREKILKDILVGFGFQIIGFISFIVVTSFPYQGSKIIILMLKIITCVVIFILLSYLYSWITKTKNVFFKIINK